MHRSSVSAEEYHVLSLSRACIYHFVARIFVTSHDDILSITFLLTVCVCACVCVCESTPHHVQVPMRLLSLKSRWSIWHRSGPSILPLELPHFAQLVYLHNFCSRPLN